MTANGSLEPMNNNSHRTATEVTCDTCVSGILLLGFVDTVFLCVCIFLHVHGLGFVEYHVVTHVVLCILHSVLGQLR
jgi:hypothetical protein